MNTPHLYYVGDLLKSAPMALTNHPEAGWIPARGIPWQGLSLRRRLSIAWGVFMGKYDAVYWEPKLRDVPSNVNIFTANAVPSKINAVTSATPAMTFKEPAGEEQTADDAAVMAAIAASTHFDQ